MSDVFRRVGRGGAGNYITENGNSSSNHSDVCNLLTAPADFAAATPTLAPDENERRLADSMRIQDVEAQKPPAPGYFPPQEQQPYARAGRGGAGNFRDAANVPEEPREHVAGRAGTAVAASSAGRSGLTGRGGVGNWSGIAAAQKSEEVKKEEELAVRVVQNVNAELAMPPKIYTPLLKDDGRPLSG